MLSQKQLQGNLDIKEKKKEKIKITCNSTRQRYFSYYLL